MSNLSKKNLDYVYKIPIQNKKMSERTVLFDKEYFITRKTEFRSLGTGNCAVVENTLERKKVRYYPRWPMFLLITGIILIIVIIMIFTKLSKETESYDNSEIVFLTSKEDILTYIVTYVPLENGMVFADSSTKLISDDTIQKMKTKYDVNIYAMLLRMGINEIYGRYGYIFGVSPWDTYYSKQNWYIQNTQSSIDFSVFNEVEIANINKLLQAEQSLKE